MDLKTFEGTNQLLDPMASKQREGVAKMRASLLACTENPSLARQAINNITVLRIYHQVARIIKYTEMMDKIEDKLYESIDSTLENMNPESRSTWMLLLDMQERLQTSMINSHKLLQPYLDLKEYTVMELAQTTEDTSTGLVLDMSSREKIRTKAQAVLRELDVGDIEEAEDVGDDSD